MSPAHKTVRQLLLIVFLGILAHGLVLTAPFKTMDDRFSIIDNRNIKDFQNAGRIFQEGFFGDHSYYRPLVALSFMVEYHFWGRQPFFYYLNNLVLHLGAALVVFFLTRRLTQKENVAFGAALLFAIHPIHWEAVTNIAGRSIVLCAFFYLGAFLFFLMAQERGKTIFYNLSLGAFILALLSKESAGMFPVLLLVYGWFFRKKRDAGLRSYVLRTVPFIIVFLVYLGWRAHLGITEVFIWPTLQYKILGFLTFLRGVITYLRLFILPLDLHFDRAREVFLSFHDPRIFFTISFFALLGGAGILLRRQLPDFILFSLCWFFLELTPVSQLVMAIGVQPGYISLAEHFLYTPSVGIFITAVWIYGRIINEAQARGYLSREIRKALAVGLCGFFLLISLSAGFYSQSETGMLARSLFFNPHNVRLLYSQGLAAAQSHHFKEAEEYFRRILKVDEADARARIALGKALCDQGRLSEGILEYEKVQDPGGFKELLADNLRAACAILRQQQSSDTKKEKDVVNVLNRCYNSAHAPIY